LRAPGLGAKGARPSSWTVIATAMDESVGVCRDSKTWLTLHRTDGAEQIRKNDATYVTCSDITSFVADASRCIEINPY